MATTKDQLTIEIAVNSEKAVKSLDAINDKLKDVSDSSKETKNSVGGFGLGMVKLQAGISLATQAFGVIKDVLVDVIASFQESYDATVKLRQALEITGSKSVDGTVKAFQDLGDELNRLGIASDETVLNLAKTGTAAGISAEKIKKMLKVAADLSVARDIPLEYAFNALTKSLKGSSGAISQFIPELSELSAEQNKSGVALEYLDAQYSGFASRNLETFSGKIEAQKGAWDELVETLGGVASEIINLGGSIDSITNKVNGLNEVAKENRLRWVAFGQAIISLLEGIKEAARLAFMSLVGMIERTVGIGIVLFGKFRSALDIFGAKKGVGQSIVKFGEDLYGMGQKHKEAFLALNINLQATDEELKIITNTVGRTEEELSKARKTAKEFNDTLENAELKKRVEDYNTALALAGKTGLDLIRAKEVEDLKELDRLAEKIKGTQGLGRANQALLATAKANVSAASAASAAEIKKKSLDELTAKTIDYQKTVNSFNATQRQQIQFELEAELQKLDIARKKAQLENNPAAVAEIDKQAGLATEAAGKKTAAAPSNMFEGLQKAGSEVAGQISGVFSEGAMGMVAGAASMAGAIMSAIDALLDFIPNILNQAAGIFNKIGDFPETLFKAFQGLFDAFSTFIPKLIRGIFDTTIKMFSQIGDFVNNLVNGIVDLIDDLPDILSNLIARLPELLVSLVENLVKAYLKLLVAIYIKLPIAIWKGLWKGFVMLIEGVKRLFKGQSFNIKMPKVDTKPLEKTVKKLSGDASKIFAVNDMMDGAKDAVNAVTDTIKGAFKKGRSDMEAVWQWVIDKVWGPLKGLVENAWQFVLKLWEGLKTIVKAAWAFVELLWHGLEETVKVAWKLVVDLWEGLKNVVSQAWQFVTDLWDALPGVVSGAWEFVSKLWEGLKAIVEAAWKFVELLWNGLGQVVAIAWKFVSDLWEGLKNVVSQAWQFVKDLWEGLKNVVSQAWQFVTDLWNALSGVVSAAWQFVTDLWNALPGVVSAAWQFVKDLWEGLKNVVSQAWQFVKDLWEGLKNIVSQAWQFVKDLFGGLKAIVEIAWKFVKDIFDGLENIVRTAFQFVQDIWDGLKQAATDAFGFLIDMWDGLKTLVSDAFSPITDFFKLFKFPSFSWPEIKIPNISVPSITLPEFDFSSLSQQLADAGRQFGNTVSSALKAPFNVIIDLINGIKFPAFDWSISAGRLGSWSGRFWDEIDLIPGSIARLAEGGIVPGFGKSIGTDTVPAMLTPGEFIMSRPAVNSIGLDNLRSMNSGKPAAAGNQTVNIEINFNDAQISMDKNLIRDKLLPEIRDALKRASLNGEFVLSNKGIRA